MEEGEKGKNKSEVAILHIELMRKSELETQQSEKDLTATKVHCTWLRGTKYHFNTNFHP